MDLGPTGGVVWADAPEWARRRTPEGCIICSSGAPLDVIAETALCWITAGPEAPLPAYVCVVAKRHVNEPYELPDGEQAKFWVEAMTVARALAGLTQPIKMNYEIHGNTLPHLHLHLFPRQLGDPYVGKPVDPRQASFHRDRGEIERMQRSIRAALAAGRES
jgi:diadenosine tetraphosphate (Ap4A) HIT family hydrolase